VPVAAGRFLADALPCAELVEFDDVGHMLPQQRVQAVAEKVGGLAL